MPILYFYAISEPIRVQVRCFGPRIVLLSFCLGFNPPSYIESPKPLYSVEASAKLLGEQYYALLFVIPVLASVCSFSNSSYSGECFSNDLMIMIDYYGLN